MNQNFVVTAVAERLLRFLEKRDNRHVLIIGERGLGKTSLLWYAAEQLKQNGSIVAIVSPTPNSSVDELVANIVRSLNVDESLLPPVLREYQGSLSLGGVLHGVRMAVGSAKPVFLFIDDIDQFSESSGLTALLENLVSDPDGLVRVVLASRRGAVASRLQRNRSMETFEPLGLTLSQSASLLQGRIGRAISTENLAVLLKLANGNPLILQLLSNSLERFNEEELAALRSSPQGPAAVLDSLLSKALDLEGQSADVQRVTAVLSVFSSATVDQLREATGLATVTVEDALRTLASNGLVFSDRGTTQFLHETIREHVVRALVLDGEVVPTDLSFGDEAAERDALLPAHFVAPPDLDQIMAGMKTIVLGDRGAGKSAVFRSLDGFQIGTQEDVIVAVSKEPAAFIQRFITHDSGVSSADRFKALWLFFASALAARDVHSRVTRSRNSNRYSKAAWRLLRQVGWTDAIRGEGRMRRIWAKVRSILPQKIAFTAGPVTIQPEWSKGDARSGSVMEIGEFIKQTDAILAELGLKLLIVVDQIDELYKYERKVQEAMVQGIFLAETHLSQTQAIRMVVLLRTDLFGVYDIQEKNKFVARTVYLRWTWPDLILQMLRRSYANEVLSAIPVRLNVAGLTAPTTAIHLRLLFPASMEGAPLKEWLEESLKNGRSEIAPRQIILFLNFLKDRARQPRRQVPIFSEVEVLDAMRDLSESAYQEVISDFRVAVAFVRNCKAAKLSVFKLTDVEKLFDSNDGSVPVQVELLERLGFLAREVVLEGDQPVARFRIPRLFTRCWG